MKEFTRMPTQYEIDQEQLKNHKKYSKLFYLSCAIALFIILLNMIIRGVF